MDRHDIPVRRLVAPPEGHADALPHLQRGPQARRDGIVEHPIDRLRWSLIHLQSIDEPRLKLLKELGCGASAQTWTYFGNGGGPPFRRIVDSGIRAGVGTDSTNVSALDPWVSLFYMTTGRNVAGMLTNDGQQISRVEALRLYTEGAAWFSFDDRHIGSFVPDKYADLAVLSHDYLTVPEQTIRRIESVMTLLGGKDRKSVV